jgi:hypothetical protein
MTASTGQRWTAERAHAWYDALPWLVGCNFTPSTAVNQLEMWQADTFDPETIDRELGWAQALGMNTMRVFLHDLAWEADADGFADRIDRYLAIASARGIRTLFVLFDDCWHNNPAIGPQPAPRPGVHNSGWVQSPSDGVIDHPETWGRLEAYVQGLLRRFGSDERVLAWDLYNEPTNLFLVDQALPPEQRKAAMTAAAQRRAARMPAHLRLFDLTFEWAHGAQPEQPLTAGAWIRDKSLNERMIAVSDVVSFHFYGDLAGMEERVASLRRHGRPMICTECIARTIGGRIDEQFEALKRERVGVYTWGLVNGKTQTHIAWSPDPSHAGVWFHDLLHADGTPYDPDEAACIRRLTGNSEQLP